MTVATDPVIFKMGNSMSNLISYAIGKKAGKLFPKVSDSAYHLLYHIPANYSIPVATLGSNNNIVYTLTELPSPNKRKLKVFILSCESDGTIHVRNPDSSNKKPVICKNSNDLHSLVAST